MVLRIGPRRGYTKKRSRRSPVRTPDAEPIRVIAPPAGDGKFLSKLGARRSSNHHRPQGPGAAARGANLSHADVNAAVVPMQSIAK
jgi:hypothetical protein